MSENKLYGYLTPTLERHLRSQGELKNVPTAEEISRLHHEIKSIEYEIRDESTVKTPAVPPEIARSCVSLSLTGMEPGVYLLLRNDVVVYVGSSNNVSSRVGDHVRERGRSYGKDFDSVVYLPCDADRRLLIEGALIRLLRPERNGNAPADGGADASVLKELGLVPHPRTDEMSKKRALLYQLRSVRSKALSGPTTKPPEPQVIEEQPNWREDFENALKEQRRKRKP